MLPAFSHPILGCIVVSAEQKVDYIEHVSHKVSCSALSEFSLNMRFFFFLGTVCVQDYLVCPRLHAAETSSQRIWLDTELWWHCTDVEGRLHHQKVIEMNCNLVIEGRREGNFLYAVLN